MLVRTHAQATFRGSEEEAQELLQLYQQHRGSMPKVFEWLVCSDPALDSHRFMDTIDAAISRGELEINILGKYQSTRVTLATWPHREKLTAGAEA